MTQELLDKKAKHLDCLLVVGCSKQLSQECLAFGHDLRLDLQK